MAANPLFCCITQKKWLHLCFFYLKRFFPKIRHWIGLVWKKCPVSRLLAKALKLSLKVLWRYFFFLFKLKIDNLSPVQALLFLGLFVKRTYDRAGGRSDNRREGGIGGCGKYNFRAETELTKILGPD